jgi:hypothetical protein
MKKIVLLVVTLALCFSAYGQKIIKKDADPETGIWKTFRVPDAAFADTLSLEKASGDSTILSCVFQTSSIMSCALEIIGRADSVDIEKIRVYQWYQYRSAALDDTNFVFISDLKWTGRTPGTAAASITAPGTYACNITATDAPITCQRFMRLEFVLRGDHKIVDGINAIVNLTTWWDKL